jgi:hypothetical protein
MITLGTMLPNMLELVIIYHHPIWEFHGIPIGQARLGLKVLGAWNFTLQADTPLYWLRCGRLDK